MQVWSDEQLPQLGATTTDHRVRKRRWGAFHGTDLEEHLRRLGVTQVVVTGVARSIGFEPPARSAFDVGFHVTVATAAVTDLTLENHRH